MSGNNAMFQLPISIDALRAIARRAGEAILEVYDSEFAVQQKEDRSPLTAADTAAHRVIAQALGDATPEIPLLSEESAAIPFAERSGWDRYWLVDPLDGTKEFIKRNGEFTVNIALIEGGESRFGVVHVPVSGVTYYGGKGFGAFRVEGAGEARPIHVAPRRRTPLKVVGSRSHAGESVQRFLAAVGEHEILSLGSSLKFCLVAEGAADIYPRLGPTSEWDTAAAQAVVEGAGGAVTDTAMQRLGYNRGESLLNPHFLVFGDGAVDWRGFLVK